MKTTTKVDDGDCWEDCVRQAKRLLSEWHETERGEARPYVHQW